MNSAWPTDEAASDRAGSEAAFFHEPPRHGRWKRRLLILGVIVVIVGAGTGAYVYSTTKNGQARYRFAKVERGAISASISASGSLNAVTIVQVGSQISGMVKQIFVDFNSPVRRNQLIARIDPETFDTKVNQAKADLESAQASVLNQRASVERARAEVDNALAAIAGARANTAKAKVAVADAKLNLDRRVDLLKREIVSQSEKDTAQAVYDSAVAALDASEAQERAAQSAARSAQAQLRVAEAQVQTAEAQVKQKTAALAQAQVDLDHTFIRAPVDGVVVSRNVDVGQTVAASLQAPVLFTIAQDLTRMQVDTNIDEADIGRAREGMDATFTVDSFPGEAFQGRVVQIRKAAQIVQNVVTYIVVIAVNNPDLKLMPGMTANVKLLVERKEHSLKIPNAALRFRPPGEGGNDPSLPRPAAQTAQQARPDGQPQGGAGSAGGGRGAGGGGGAAQQEEFRKRLITELSLTQEQQAKLDAIQAEQRQAFRAMFQGGGGDEKARENQRRRILAEGREKLKEILTPDQRKKFEAVFGAPPGGSGAQAAAAPTPGRVFIAGPDGKPKAVQVMLGLTDGSSTEIVRGEIGEGQEVIVGVTGQPRGGGSTQPRLRL